MTVWPGADVFKVTINASTIITLQIVFYFSRIQRQQTKILKYEFVHRKKV